MNNILTDFSPARVTIVDFSNTDVEIKLISISTNIYFLFLNFFMRINVTFNTLFQVISRWVVLWAEEATTRFST